MEEQALFNVSGSWGRREPFCAGEQGETGPEMSASISGAVKPQLLLALLTLPSPKSKINTRSYSLVKAGEEMGAEAGGPARGSRLQVGRDHTASALPNWAADSGRAEPRRRAELPGNAALGPSARSGGRHCAAASKP